MTARQYGEYGLFVLIFFLLAWLFLLSDAYETVSTLRKQVATIEEQQDLLQQKIRELQDLDKKSAVIKTDFKQIQQFTKNGLPQILAYCEQLSRQSGLNLRSFEPQEKTVFDVYGVQTIIVNLSGPFAAQQNFLQRLGSQENLLTFKHLVLARDAKNKELDLRLVFQSYKLLFDKKEK